MLDGMKRKGGLLLLIVLAILPGWAFAGRCATGLRSEKPGRFKAVPPLLRRAARREAAPVPARNANEFVTEHFRLIWGDAYDRSDPEWADADANGRPDWVDETATALEYAYSEVIALGFPAPYGSNPEDQQDGFYLDVYFGNTGMEVCSREAYDPNRPPPPDRRCQTELGPGEWVAVTVDSSYYAYTEIDTDYRVAYFVFNDDFSKHAEDEFAVLRATAAHELFHAVQRALGYPWDDEVLVPEGRWRSEGWWFEATATWMEEVVAPDVDDYVTYVQKFLAAPDEPLGSQDGLREYGAAIFPGYLWLRHGGPGLWIDVFAHAFQEGLEPALRAALGARDEPPLEDVVAAFWTLAAHPEDTWPDGALFRSSSFSPRLTRSADTLPLEYASSWSTAPGRFGANLFRVEGAPPAVVASLSKAEPVPSRLALSRGGKTAVWVVDPGEAPEVVQPGNGGALYVAVVNVGPSADAFDYTLSLNEADSPSSGVAGSGVSGSGAGTSSGGESGPVSSEDSGDIHPLFGSGGCFLRSLVWE